MKKFVKGLGITLMVGLMATMLVACGANGTYKYDSVKAYNGDEVITLPEEATAMLTYFQNMEIKIKGDEMISIIDGEESEPMKFKKDGKKLIPIDDDGEEIETSMQLEINGNKFIYTVLETGVEGITKIVITFKK